jgi:uncharacterized protein (TIGR03083 family)
MADVVKLAFDTRDELFEVIKSLTDADMALPTACDQWSVKHLVAHMTALGNQSFPNFAKGMLTSGFNFDKFVDRDLQKYMKGTDEMIAGFNKTMARTKPSPGPKYVMLGEYTVHGEDIRRALGRQGEHEAERMEPLFAMYSKTKAPLNGKVRAEGLKFVATDGDWTFGEGPEVSGPGIDLVMAITGRTGAVDNLSGPAVATLRSRA